MDDSVDANCLFSQGVAVNTSPVKQYLITYAENNGKAAGDPDARVTDAYVSQVLSEAERMIEQAALEVSDRNEMESLVQHYHGLRAKAFGTPSVA